MLAECGVTNSECRFLCLELGCTGMGRALEGADEQENVLSF